jgi:two-component system, NarL family, capsular synthesis sensor histidine kinase RcsC
MARILVTDDEAIVRRAVLRMLAAGGHDAVEAPDAAAGLRVWREQGADVVVVDIAMPRYDSFEVIGLLRSKGETVPIVAISGSLVVSDTEMLRRTKSLGGVRLLFKPFSQDQLLSAISAALASEAP